MVLEAARGIEQMLTASYRQRGIVVIILTPEKIIPIQLVLLDAERGKLIRVVTQPLGGQKKFIEIAAMTFLRVDRQVAAEQADSVAEIYIAAIFAEVAVHVMPAV